MSSSFDGLVDRTIRFAQDLLGDIVGASLRKARRALARHAAALGIGVAGLVLALVFAAIGANRWLESIMPENRRWAPPLIVAGAVGIVGIIALRSASGGGQDRE